MIWKRKVSVLLQRRTENSSKGQHRSDPLTRCWKKVYDQLKECGLSYVDVTCPFVLKIHRIVEKESKAGSHIVIIGDPDHPEVVGICGWCIGSYTVIRTKQDALDFVPPESKNVCIVSQTTFNYNKFQVLVEIICKKRYDISMS